MKNFLVAGSVGLALMFSGTCNAAVTTGHRTHPANHTAVNRPGANQTGVKLAAAHRTGMRKGARGTKTSPFHHTHTGQHVTHHSGTHAATTKPTTTTNTKSTPAVKPTTPTPVKK